MKCAITHSPIYVKNIRRNLTNNVTLTVKEKKNFSIDFKNIDE